MKDHSGNDTHILPEKGSLPKIWGLGRENSGSQHPVDMRFSGWCPYPLVDAHIS